MAELKGGCSTTVNPGFTSLPLGPCVIDTNPYVTNPSEGRTITPNSILNKNTKYQNFDYFIYNDYANSLSIPEDSEITNGDKTQSTTKIEWRNHGQIKIPSLTSKFINYSPSVISISDDNFVLDNSSDQNNLTPPSEDKRVASNGTLEIGSGSYINFGITNNLVADFSKSVEINSKNYNPNPVDYQIPGEIKITGPGQFRNESGGKLINNSKINIDDSSKGTIHNNSTIENGSSSDVSAYPELTIGKEGNLLNNENAEINNYAIINNNGVIQANGNINNFIPKGIFKTPKGVILNEGTFIMPDSAKAILNNHALFKNGGSPTTTVTPVFTIGVGAKLNNGKPDVESTGSIENFGSLINSGDIESWGVFENRQYGESQTIKGSISNKSKLVSSGEMRNFDNAIITNEKTGELINTGTFHNLQSGIITNIGNMHNGSLGDDIDNRNTSITLDKNGTFNNGSTESSDGTLNNYAKITNAGTFGNKGKITNYSSASISNTGQITNEGSITNQSSAELENEGTIDINFGGSFSNSGVMTNGRKDGAINSTLNCIGAAANNSGGKITNYTKSNIIIGDAQKGSQNFTNNFGANLLNEGIIDVKFGSLQNLGTLMHNAGTINVYVGELDNTGEMSIGKEASVVLNPDGPKESMDSKFSNTQSLILAGLIDASNARAPKECVDPTKAGKGFCKRGFINTGTIMPKGTAALIKGIWDDNGTIKTGGPSDANSHALTIDGNYTQGESGLISLTLRGHDKNNTGNIHKTKYDRIVINGNADLTGKIQINTPDNFSLKNGKVFDLIRVTGNLSGNFKGSTEGDVVAKINGSNDKKKKLRISYSGGNGNDVILYSKGNNFVNGGVDDDTLKGSNKNERAFGRDGDDIIDTGNGKDYAHGGRGDDTFIINNGKGYVRILDFYNGQDSIIYQGSDNLTLNNGSKNTKLFAGGDLLAKVMNKAHNELTINDDNSITI